MKVVGMISTFVLGATLAFIFRARIERAVDRMFDVDGGKLEDADAWMEVQSDAYNDDENL